MTKNRQNKRKVEKGRIKQARGAPRDEPPASRQRKENEDQQQELKHEPLQYADPFEDEYVAEDAGEEMMQDVDEKAPVADDDAPIVRFQGDLVDDAEEEKQLPERVWLPHMHELGPDEKLEYDSSAYLMYHPLDVEWPCLSFDIARDNLGDMRTTFPMTCYVLAGTQADRANNNKVQALKFGDLHKTKHDDDEDDDENASDSDDDLDDDPIVEERGVKHVGTVNRIRAMPQASNLVATWSDTGKVHIFDMREHLKALDTPPTGRPPQGSPIFTFEGHRTEGFAMDWSPVAPGKFATGDCSKHIHLWEPRESTWAVDPVSLAGHTSSVEDLQWSPEEANVLASCSSDRTIKIWDTRAGKKKAMFTIRAHNSDVNVISWNRLLPHLLLSGSDDGSFKTWDLQKLSQGHTEAAAHFTWHRGAITSIEWHPHDDSQLAVASADNSITIWDLSLENDSSEKTADDVDVPPQLLFIHQGQTDIKELHHHPQMPGVIISTALSGFNIFKPANT